MAGRKKPTEKRTRKTPGKGRLDESDRRDRPICAAIWNA
jgi:hypothetical protein